MLTLRSEHGLHRLVVGSQSDGGGWPNMAGDVDDYDPRDARFVRKASDGSIAESRKSILDEQIARLSASVRSRGAQEESSSVLMHYAAVLRELREETAGCQELKQLSGASAASTGSTLSPRSEHGLHSLVVGSESDGGEWPYMAGDDGGDPRDIRFVRKAPDASVAESRKSIVDDQIARLGAALRALTLLCGAAEHRRSPRRC